VPHSIAPPDPEIGSAAERGCASTDEAKLWVEGPLRKKSRQRSRRMLHALRCNGAREDGFAARPLVRMVVRYPGRAARDQRLELGPEERGCPVASGNSVDRMVGLANSRRVWRRSEAKGRSTTKNPPRAGPGRLRRDFVRRGASSEAHPYTIAIYAQ